LKHIAGCALGLALLAGCGGGGGSSPAPPPAQLSGSASTANVNVVIEVPRGASATSRSPQYVSSGTANISVTVGALNASAPCVSPATTCTVSIAAPLGSDSFTVSLFDGSSNLLATGTTVFTVVANALNTIPLTFGGVIQSLTLSFSTPTILQGAASSSNLTIVAKDAAGFTIVQPGNYTAPIVVTTAPSLPAAFSLIGATTITAIPATNSVISASYNGTATSATSIAFTATAGAITGSATLTIPTPGGVTVSAGTLQFTAIPASAQTVTIGETNYAGTFSRTPAGCGSIASVGAITGGNQFSVTPLGVGSCTVSAADTLGNSQTVTIDVATTSITGS
jgi:hypothetical protein